MAVNEVANISGTYGYFLSNFKKNSLNNLCLKEELFSIGNATGHTIIQGYAEQFGTVTIDEIDYNRFKSNDSQLPQKITEYLISIER